MGGTERLKGRLVEPGTVRTELDGIPVFWYQAAGALRVSVAFRVGRADETLARGGLTRLVSHLAAMDTGIEPEIGLTRTTFTIQGPNDEVARALDHLGSALSSSVSAGVDLADALRELWKTAPDPSADVAAELLAKRFGPRGPGLGSYPEYGLWCVTPAEVEAWRARFFHTSNAAMWAAGPSLDGVNISLPSGIRPADPKAAGRLSEYPAAFRWPREEVGVSMVSTWSMALAAGLECCRRRVQTTLPDGSATSLDFETLAEQTVHATLAVRGAGSLAPAAAEALRTSIDELARTGPSEPELEAFVETAEAGALGASGDPARLQRWCDGALRGVRVPPVWERLADAQALTPTRVAAEMATASGTALYAIPPGLPVPPPGCAPTAQWSALPRAPERLHRAAEGDPTYPDRHVALEPDGVTVVLDNTRAVRVGLAGATMLRWNDGCRGLWSDDGFYVELDPTEWADGAALVSWVDARIPLNRVVPIRRDEIRL